MTSFLWRTKELLENRKIAAGWVALCATMTLLEFGLALGKTASGFTKSVLVAAMMLEVVMYVLFTLALLFGEEHPCES